MFNPLASLCSCVDWIESYLVTNPEDRLSRVEAHIFTHCILMDSSFWFDTFNLG